MIRHICIAAVAISCSVGPAFAQTYSGTLNGVITSGTATQDQGFPFPPSNTTVDLVGKAIAINFTSNVNFNYTDPVWGDFYPKYVVNTVTVNIPAAAGVNLGSVGSTQSNNINLFFSFADFTGDAQNGAFVAVGQLIPFEPDLTQSVSFSFANAASTLRPLTGSGTANAYFYLPFTETTLAYSVSFRLTNGWVTGPGQGTAAPEPATWAMMIAGFGAIGALMRRQRRFVRVSLA